MAAPTNTVITTTGPGMREDLEDVIYRVAPEETPFYSNIGTAKAANTYHEWQTEGLATPIVNNSALEGNAFTIAAGNLTSRVGNSCQIVTKAFGVSRTEDVVKKAGRTSELNRQKVLKGIEAKRDFEFTIIGNNPARAEGGGNGRLSGGALAWIVSNTSVGAAGSNGGWSSAPGPVAATNGTLRAFTEAQLKTVMAACFSAGGKPNQIYVGPIQKQEFSAFTGIASIRHEAAGTKMTALIGAADVYVSDFGNLTAIPHPYGLTRDALFIDPSMWAVGVLDGWKSVELAQVSDSTQYAVTYEACLIGRNEKSSGAVRDLT